MRREKLIDANETCVEWSIGSVLNPRRRCISFGKNPPAGFKYAGTLSPPCEYKSNGHNRDALFLIYYINICVSEETRTHIHTDCTSM